VGITIWPNSSAIPGQCRSGDLCLEPAIRVWK
jgi:hypothetical protein